MNGFHRLLLVLVIATLFPVATLCAQSAFHDDNGVSFTPAIEFRGEVLENGTYLSAGFLHADLRYKPGEPIDMALATHNVCPEPRKRLEIELFGVYLVEVKDQARRSVPFTKEGEKAKANADSPFRAKLTPLKPGRSYRQTYPLSQYFAMSVSGVYSITISRSLDANYEMGAKPEVGPVSIAVGDVGADALERMRKANQKLKPRGPNDTSKHKSAPPETTQPEIKPLEPFNSQDLVITFTLDGTSFMVGQRISGEIGLRYVGVSAVTVYNAQFHELLDKPGRVRIFDASGKLVAQLLQRPRMGSWVGGDEQITLYPGDSVGNTFTEKPWVDFWKNKALPPGNIRPSLYYSAMRFTEKRAPQQI